MIVPVQGIILRSQDLAESDKRLTLYTKELGKIRAKIVGIKKSASKLRSLSMVFSESHFQIYLHGTKRAGPHDPGKIIGGETIQYHLPLRSDWNRMIQTATFCETIDALTHASYPNPNEYELLNTTLMEMEQTSNPLLVRLKSTLILLKYLGYSLKHHAIWKAYDREEKQLMIHLAKWQGQNETFTEDQLEQLEKMVHAYLSHYLPHPLKTVLFQQKMEAAIPAVEARSL